MKKVKAELKELRHLSHSINALMAVQKRLCERLEWLRAKSNVDKEEIEKTCRQIASINLTDKIRRSVLLEQKYMTIIWQLPSIDQTIIIEAFINGLPYWKVGQIVGYSQDGIKKRIPLALAKVQKLLDSQAKM